MGRWGGDLPRRLRPHVRIAARGRKGGAAAPVSRSSPARAAKAPPETGREAQQHAQLSNPWRGRGATARGLRGKGARHQPATPPAVPWPDGDGPLHTQARPGRGVGAINAAASTHPGVDNRSNMIYIYVGRYSRLQQQKNRPWLERIVASEVLFFPSRRVTKDCSTSM